eukprot:TRINITY_DN53315_c0_g5_i1.p1 TRINITY_DN53315_c0_g5~~TRINITY_DN53315_c0_g5_i1.p1  ORF type:complete len:645 (-),score=62.33 TRINITY_DN53315_c0_g5_i1:45-1979(-)
MASNAEQLSASRKPALRKLVSKLPRDMIRGVPSHVSLQGYGRYWSGSTGGIDDFLSSQETDRINDFISHDWHTSRWVKYITLCYIYNGEAAVVGAILISALVVVARETVSNIFLTQQGTLANAYVDIWGFLVIGYLAFLSLLFHWQKIRSKLCKSKLLFVDKLCIDQDDENMKGQAIQGLAAFLKCSQRLVVLWSPTYFSRLWCTYELATWFRYEKPLSSLLFVPVEIPPLHLGCSALMMVTGLAHYARALSDPETDLPIGAMSNFVSCLLGAYLLQGHVQNVAGLRQVLESFSVQRASCFCCSNDHRHPDTGARLLCDREMVYLALQEWTMHAGGDAGQEGDHLAIFNREVRTTLKEHVTDVLPEEQLFIGYAGIIFGTFPFLLLTLDWTVLRIKLGNEDWWLYLVQGLAVSFLTIPLAVNILMRSMYTLRHCKGLFKRSRKAKLILASCLWGPLGYVLFVCLWLCVNVDLHLQNGVIWPLFLVIILKIPLTCCLFARSCYHGRLHAKSYHGHLPAKRFSLNDESAGSIIGQSGKAGAATGPAQVGSRSTYDGLAQDVQQTSAAASLTDTAFDHKSAQLNLHKAQVRHPKMQGAHAALQEDRDVWIPFDESWQPVAEKCALRALGPVYSVDLGGGEVGSVIRL